MLDSSLQSSQQILRMRAVSSQKEDEMRGRLPVLAGRVGGRRREELC